MRVLEDRKVRVRFWALKHLAGSRAFSPGRGFAARSGFAFAVIFAATMCVKAQLAPMPAGVPQNQLPSTLQNVGIEQRLNDQIPLDLHFTDEDGQDIELNRYFGQRPVILTLVYYQCPMLCTQILNGVDRSIKVLSLELGKDFEIVSVSINPRETPRLASEKKFQYLRSYAHPEAAEGWHFLTGSQESIEHLAASVGYKYQYDPKSDLYAHASGIIVLTPTGKVSRYFYGIEYAPRDLRLGLIEASENKIGTPVDKVLLYCFHYDPSTGKYSLLVMNLVRLGGILTIIGVVLMLIIINRRRKKEIERRVGLEGWQLALLPLFPEQASSHAAAVDELLYFLLVITVFFTLLIFFLIIYYMIKYRRRRADEVGGAVVPFFKLEVAWIAIPFMIAMVIFVWGAELYFDASVPPNNSLEVYVVGKQWMWKIQHIGGQREINELHVPVGRDIKLTMTTEDVIHSFFVPAFRVKADVVPGRYSSTWFRATKTGQYHLFCAEYCGTNHSGMIGWVYVMEPAEYGAWLSGGPTEGSLASNGQKLFQQLGCSTCHQATGQGRGPSLIGIYGKPVQLSDGTSVTADDNYIRESILDPKAKIVAGFQPLMPTFQGIVSEEQLLQLTAYIKSLGSEATPLGAGGIAPAPGVVPKR
jgi:cytochrome c oxidase subunit 2